jgi:hypothetical protein
VRTVQWSALYRASGDVINSYERVLHNVHTLTAFLGEPPLSRPGAWAYADGEDLRMQRVVACTVHRAECSLYTEHRAQCSLYTEHRAQSTEHSVVVCMATHDIWTYPQPLRGPSAPQGASETSVEFPTSREGG